MQPDNVMPNDGTYFLPREPEEQVIDRKKERAQTLEAESIIKNLISHFDERVAYLEKIDSIQGVSITTKPAEFQKAFLVNRLLKQALIEEQSLLEDLLETHHRG